MTTLLTGGAGYIGSHTCIELLEHGQDVVIADNLCNSKREVLNRIQTITGKRPKFYLCDLCRQDELSRIFSENQIDAVIHLAGLKAVGESVSHPLDYYRNNLLSVLNLLQCMKEFRVKNLVFSSSATVYGDPATVPITEDFPLSTTNPYGTSKLMTEQILLDLCHADPSWNVILLRYFNPIGAHVSGLIGEDPNGVPNNLIPYITQVAIGKLKQVQVFGNQYPTKDGTGVRDYIHVVDLAKGHLAALKQFPKNPGLEIYNLGTGLGYSVLEMIEAFRTACGCDIPYVITDPRPGDIAACYADSGKAHRELGWRAEKTLQDMCEDSWRWQQQNPDGYPDEP